jgi:PDZ domain-containing secreted protein
MKKIFILTIGLILLTSNVFAYNPNTYFDEEELTVDGKRPKVNIELQELTITISVDDFVDGIAEKSTVITNSGNKDCVLTVTLVNVPVDLTVNATVDTDTLGKGESTGLNISVELGDQMEAEDFTFTVIVKAEML